ncbi:hypothetical protein ANN_20810 [Periplaneta americana]|uniref:Uncharacterized protein n=1 Tax=Periplaneta americana TaxID=6978 RepID=A0ABQ8SDN9_PERAM|nr:hypothetical protein ANN_20810 [Periplaneta americana]
MAGLCEGGNEPPGSLKASNQSVRKPEQASQSCVPEFDSRCVRICVSIRRPEFECSGPQLEGPEFECSGPQLEGPEFEYSELSLKEPVATRSPDLTMPDFFLWGYLKDRVYATRPQTLDDLKHNITQEIQAIDNRVLQRVASNMERRVELCLMQDGGYFQHLL